MTASGRVHRWTVRVRIGPALARIGVQAASFTDGDGCRAGRDATASTGACTSAEKELTLRSMRSQKDHHRQRVLQRSDRMNVLLRRDDDEAGGHDARPARVEAA
jgi:hypothetical protein